MQQLWSEIFNKLVTGQDNWMSCNEKNSFERKDQLLFLSLEKDLNRRKKGPMYYINHIYSFRYKFEYMYDLKTCDICNHVNDRKPLCIKRCYVTWAAKVESYIVLIINPGVAPFSVPGPIGDITLVDDVVHTLFICTRVCYGYGQIHKLSMVVTLYIVGIVRVPWNLAPTFVSNKIIDVFIFRASGFP